jgi:nucleotide-binding universal stress UspA family protein
MSSDAGTGRRRVVVGVDGSDPSKQALRWGAQLAASLGAQIEAVQVWRYPYGFEFAYVGPTFELGSDTEKALTETVDEVFGSDRPIDMRLTVVEGGAATVLLRESKGAAMVVVGSRGHGGFAGLLLGSVSAKVAEHADCPVLVVHGDGSPAQAMEATS